MLLKANRKNLKAHAKALLGEKHSLEAESALIKEALTPPDYDTGWHPSHERADHLNRLSDIMNAFGCEGILEGNVDVQYVNMGDTYATTLLYWEDELWIGDWGSIVEESGGEQ